MIYEVLEGLIGLSVFSFFDDILIASDSREQHKTDLCEVLQRLITNSLAVNKRKSALYQTEIVYLGYIISKDGISILPERSEEVINLQKPRTVKALRSTLGKFKFCQPFIKNFSELVTPMQVLVNTATKTQTFIQWNDDANNSWNQIVKAIHKAPSLAHYDPNKPFEVHCDASNTAVGAMLSQDSRPIEFLSRSLSNPQRHYPVHDKELLSIITSLKKWQSYIGIQKVTVFTDHKPLRHLLSQRSLSDRQIRWLSFISLFDVSIDYLPGSNNVIADILSRPQINLTQEITLEQRLINSTRANREEMEKVYGANRTSDGLMFDDEMRIIVPPCEEIQNTLIQDAHSSPICGHFGPNKTLARIMQLFRWRGIQTDVVNFLQNVYDLSGTRNAALRSLLVYCIHYQTQMVHGTQCQMDYLYIEFDEQCGVDSILVIMDRFSHRCRLFACSTHITAQETAEIIVDHIVKIHGVPACFITDRDTRFMGEAFKHMENIFGIKHRFTTARHPETNGLVERTNRTILQLLTPI